MEALKLLAGGGSGSVCLFVSLSVCFPASCLPVVVGGLIVVELLEALKLLAGGGMSRQICLSVCSPTCVVCLPACLSVCLPVVVVGLIVVEALKLLAGMMVTAAQQRPSPSYMLLITC